MARARSSRYATWIRNLVAMILIALHFWVVGVSWAFLKGRMSTEEIMGTMAILCPVTAAIAINILTFFASSHRAEGGPTHFIFLFTVSIAAPTLGYWVYDLVKTYHDTPGSDGNSLRIALGIADSTIAGILTLISNMFSRNGGGPRKDDHGGGGDGSLSTSG